MPQPKQHKCILLKLEAGYQRQVVAEALLLVFHTFVGAAGHKAAIELILL